MKPIQFKNGRGQTLRGFIHVPQEYDTVIVFLHGFPSHCAGFSASRYAKLLERTNYLFLTFDFSHTDTSDGKFEDKLMSNEVKDIRSAIDFLDKNYGFKKLILIGHSTGAIDGALYAHTDSRITKLILTGAVGNLKTSVRFDFTDVQVRDFWKNGHIIYDAPEKWYHHKKLKKSFYDEFFTLDIPTAIAKFKKPLLIVHGEKDEDVELKAAEELFSLANQPKKMVVITGADHSFTQPKHGKKLLKVVGKFIEGK